MEYKDYYKVMGLKNDATPKDVKLAYRRLARKYHPDLSKEVGAEAKFKEVGEAYEVLKDPEKRQAYDQYGRDWELRQKSQASRNGDSWGGDYSDHGDAADFFESLFGAKSPKRRRRAGADLRANINISLEEAYAGGMKEVQLSSDTAGIQTLRVKIPVGVKSGQQLRLTGQGGDGVGGGAKGDLYLTINVNQHPLFDVKGNDIYLTLPITPWEAALGANIQVPTLGGRVDVKIPANSQAGSSMRLKKRGLPGTIPGTIPGDQFIVLKVVIPQPTTDAERKLYQDMATTMPFNPREKMGI